MNTTESIQLGNGITVSGTPCQVYPAATVRYDPQEGVSVSYDGGETWHLQHTADELYCHAVGSQIKRAIESKARVGKPCARKLARKPRAPKKFGRSKCRR